MTLALRAPLSGASAHADAPEQIVVLLDHDTDWGRDFRAWLMSWGIDVLIGPHMPEVDAAPILVMGPDAFATDVIRRRLRLARSVLPQAPLMLVTAPTHRIRPQPGSLAGMVALPDLLRSGGMGFVSEADA